MTRRKILLLVIILLLLAISVATVLSNDAIKQAVIWPGDELYVYCPTGTMSDPRQYPNTIVIKCVGEYD